MGEDEFIRRARLCGVDGVIVPDLPFEEARGFAKRCAKGGVDMISFISPTTDSRRARSICRDAKGFIYYVSLTGVTGLRQKLPVELARGVSACRRLARVPVCVGFGVSTPAQVRQVQRFSDGVIVGSAIIRKIRDSIGTQGFEHAVVKFVRQLAGAS
jgi:tryptophan synthase alpha chain